ncbi:RNA polymerase sigma factor sigA-like [Bidens hawaiensis]|uniref:RNA polymerase sigma factor sigA-like n=1 Tax=Bidens hawaiensis TaxID=980011 RepID=UPI004049A60F
MMVTSTVIGLRALASSSYYSDITEKLSSSHDVGYISAPIKNVIAAKKSSTYGHGFVSKRHTQDTRYIRALKQHADTGSDSLTMENWIKEFEGLEQEYSDQEFSVDALLLLQKSLLEKQWNLSTESALNKVKPIEESSKRVVVSGSVKSARRRRLDSKNEAGLKQKLKFVISSELLQTHASDTLLTHDEVAVLSKKIKTGQRLERWKSRLKEKLGCEPSEVQLAASMKISRAELQIKQIECKLAREKLAMSNIRLVMSVAQKYANTGVEIGDLIQGGVIGLLRGIEKYDSSRGFKISTYVFWWIRQGVSKALIENSRTLRVPTHNHERLSAIRHAKAKLEEKGIAPSIENIAESLNISTKKVLNATGAKCKVFSLDRPVSPSLNGLPGQTFHSYMADDHVENNPWHGVDNLALKDEMNKLMVTTLREREREIIRLYYGLDNEFLSWEDISRRMGLSRERVRQIGLVALEKLKHAARKTNLEAMLVEH